ncbi:MAG: hypothetical protein LBB23_01770 [Rickettsiales bacterium]|nr:hypothetical protein [Rickettsiales bacterium]
MSLCKGRVIWASVLVNTNHPVRLRFATARHPSTLEGNLFAEIPRSSRGMTY